jgi:hypothetical protein
MRRLALPLLLIAGGILALASWNFSNAGEQHFVNLAQSFLEGHLYLLQQPESGWGDTSLYQERHYWPLGPLPAVLLMPFVLLFGPSFQQGYVLFVSNLLSLYLLYRIASRITGTANTALWLAFGFTFGTAYVYVATVSWSWYLSQALGNLLLLLALNEYFGPRRFWIIGMVLAVALATRITLGFAGIFFAGAILLEGAKEEKRTNLIRLGVPMAASMALLLGYNYLRFDHLLEFGYGLQLIYGEPAANRAHGVWSFVHFPANLYYFLLKGPEAVFVPRSKVLTSPYVYANGWGMSILFTSPLFLWIFKASLRDRLVRLCALTSGAMLFAILGYYGIGVRQYGYRYAIDFYPFLLVILCLVLKTGMSPGLKGLIVLSAVFNMRLLPLTIVPF